MQNQTLANNIEKACKKIAPVWPLKNSVAVNPYFGMTETPFDSVAHFLDRTSGIKVTMPIQFYLDKIESKEILYIDIYEALAKHKKGTLSIDTFIKDVNSLKDVNSNTQNKGLTVIDAVEELTGKSWNEFMIDEISAWASSYFDEDQALWKTSNKKEGLFYAWKKDAELSFAPKWMGLKKFNSTLKQISDDQEMAIGQIIARLGISDEVSEVYLHTLLLRVLGWSSFISGIDFNNALYEGESKNVKAFLAILLCWELALLENFKAKGIDNSWNKNKENLSNTDRKDESSRATQYGVILQDAYDFASQRELKHNFNSNKSVEQKSERPNYQAVFCIDVRSEVYRRNLESIDQGIETIGFAGFFGFPINFIPIANEAGKNQCPVLLPSGPVVKETLSNKEDLAKATKVRKVKHQVIKSWKTFRSGPVSSFSFVSPLGIFFLPKLISNALGWSRPVEDPDIDGLGKDFKHHRRLDLSSISLSDKANMATSALTAMGLKDTFAPLVLITGHGSTSVNNPHATGLDCGACGGHSGEINAMTAEAVLNDMEVRNILAENGIEIPTDTHFIAGLHDTTTDDIFLAGEPNVPNSHTAYLNQLKDTLKQASVKSRLERSLRFNFKTKDIDTSFVERSKDWSQVRPEWGLTGCNAFVIAPRNRTKGMNLKGKSFLHSYDWREDKEFKVLEAIMTAPMVVTSWINLQYFASLTDNKRMGSGNKTLHNVTGGFGVLEGSSGDLRIGLPWQSLHDGKDFQHLPQRLNVIIDAPIDAINTIIAKHPMLKNLFDNNWIFLLGIDENGELSSRYQKDLKWEELNYDDQIISKMEKEFSSMD
ncbi:DUF2309 domain-containing protein [Crocinitomicaceae bacterium]|nr:DUF2309 domain-containing protein [Crocinitomicaceae bacterium]